MTPHLPTDLPTLTPPESEDPIRVAYRQNPRWKAWHIPSHFRVSRWLWEWFKIIQPSFPCIYLDGNGHKRSDGSEGVCLRFTEYGARPGLLRYLCELDARLRNLAGLGRRPPLRGASVAPVDGDCTNVLTSNGRRRWRDPVPDAPGVHPKKTRTAAESVLVRTMAALEGRDPDLDWVEF